MTKTQTSSEKCGCKESKELRKHLKTLVEAVRLCLLALDHEMTKPSTPERGSKIAKISNALEMAKDSARFFGLGESYRHGRGTKE